MKLELLEGFERIYQVTEFPAEFKAMFKKNMGESVRYRIWLSAMLTILDENGMNVLQYMQFEYLQQTESPKLYAIRHPHSKINERYIYACEELDGEKMILLTAFKEKSAEDYSKAIERAKSLYAGIEKEDSSD
jgi:hypothetical protein